MDMQPVGADEQETEDFPADKPAHALEQNDQVTVELSLLCFGSDLDLVPYWRSGPDEGRKITLDNLRRVSVETNKAVSHFAAARTGRNFQRYAQVINQHSTGRKSNAIARLTTGAVPILNDGKILLVLSKKSGWVLPKGGWENDETLEEGAIREVFEEAGVIGLLGPPFPSITYETKKARKRRFASEASSITENSFSDTPLSDTELSLGEVPVLPISTTDGTNNGLNGILEYDQSQPKPSDIKQHSHNHMTLFPLYVQQVFDVWPELDRSRRAFSIDQAEDFLAHRPEYLAVLQAVKESNLHRVCSRSTKVNV